MPHSELKRRAQHLNSGVGNCPCCQTFDYASERDLNIKLWLHHKVCSKPAEGIDQLRVPKKAMTLREQQIDEAERSKRIVKHH